VTEVVNIEEIKKEILLKIMSEGDLSWKYVETLPKDDSLRTFMCELGPMYAYEYTYLVDRSPHDDTRKAACEDPEYAYRYALYVDKWPREDTRRAACKGPQVAHWYAIYVDRSPSEDTRKAAYRDPYWKKDYIARFGE
jgi:hypothetical protein